jgi:hypothetical protein
MYENCEKIVDLVSSAVSADNSLDANLFNAYDKLAAHGIVEANELVALESWISDSMNQLKAG